MKVYRTVEFDQKDMDAIYHVQFILYEIAQYNLREEVKFFDWPSFTGDFDRLEKYVKDNLKE